MSNKKEQTNDSIREAIKEHYEIEGWCRPYRNLKPGETPCPDSSVDLTGTHQNCFLVPDRKVDRRNGGDPK